MKKIFSVLLFVCMMVNLYADQYDDMVRSLSNKSNDVKFYQYQLYQKEHPEIGNVYFQMGLLSYDYLLNTNPLTDIYAFKQHVYNSKLYFGSALHFTNAANLRKYSEHYAVLGVAKPEITHLAEFVNKKNAEIESINQRGIRLNEAFVKLSSNYERCVQLFAKLNSQYESMNMLYLLINNEIREDMRVLKSISDSIQLYISEYKDALNDFPINGYNPKFNILPIELFRIDALCSVNLITDNIVMYDFGLWVDKFERHYQQRVLPVLNQSGEVYSSLLSNENSRVPMSLVNSLYQMNSHSYVASVLLVVGKYNEVKDYFNRYFSISDMDKRISLLYEMGLSYVVMNEKFAELQKIEKNQFVLFHDFTDTYFQNENPAEELKAKVLEGNMLYDSVYKYQLSLIPETVEQEQYESISVTCPDNTNVVAKYSGSQYRNTFVISNSDMHLKKIVKNDAMGPLLWMSYVEEGNRICVVNESSTYDSDASVSCSFLNLSDWGVSNFAVLNNVLEIKDFSRYDDGYVAIVVDKDTGAISLYVIDKFGIAQKTSVADGHSLFVKAVRYNSRSYLFCLKKDGMLEFKLVTL